MARPQLSRNLTTDLLGLGGLLLLNLILFSDVFFNPPVLSQEQEIFSSIFFPGAPLAFPNFRPVIWSYGIPLFMREPFFGTSNPPCCIRPTSCIVFTHGLRSQLDHRLTCRSFRRLHLRLGPFQGLSPSRVSRRHGFHVGGALYLHLSAGHLPTFAP